MEAGAGAGMMLGPLIGTGLYAIGGYVFMLTFCGCTFLVLALLVPCALPKYLDKYTDAEH